MKLDGLCCWWFLFYGKLLLFAAGSIHIRDMPHFPRGRFVAYCPVFNAVIAVQKTCVPVAFMKIHVCFSPHNVLNSSNTRTNLASQRLLSSLLVLVLTLATIPSTISAPLFTLLDKNNNCKSDYDDINEGG